MKKIIVALFFLSILSPAVLADFEDMMGSGMMGTGTFSLVGLFGIVWFALAAFIFSVIFWATHNWLVKGKRR
jgi:hypothetical protein